MLKNKADPNLKNRDGQSPLDIAMQLDDEDLIDILKGDLALLDYVKKGNLQRVKKLLNEANINCRDTSGRHSSGLHLAAGYNHLEIAEFFLQNNANAEIKDKGGLIALHNAASYNHVEMAALLLKYNPKIINVTDKWGYTVGSFVYASIIKNEYNNWIFNLPRRCMKRRKSPEHKCALSCSSMEPM